MKVKGRHVLFGYMNGLIIPKNVKSSKFNDKIQLWNKCNLASTTSLNFNKGKQE